MTGDARFAVTVYAGSRRRAHADQLALAAELGTLEEVSEILVERQLRFHHEPLVLVNAGGFWDPLLALFAGMREADLLSPEHAEVVDVVPDVAGVMRAIANRRAAPARAPVEKG